MCDEYIINELYDDVVSEGWFPHLMKFSTFICATNDFAQITDNDIRNVAIILNSVVIWRILL